MSHSPASLTGLALAVVAAVGIGTVAGPAAAQKNDESPAVDTEDSNVGSARIVDYQGRIEDGKGRPISGVFELVFKLYDTKDGSDPLWSESRHVAVVDGKYTIPLGRSTDLTDAQVDEASWIGVELGGQGEILRDRFEVETGAKARAAKRKSQIERLIEKAKSDEQMAFADVARHAVSADRAEVAATAEKIGSLTADEIETRSQRALERLADHKTDPDAHGASGGKLGDRTRVMDSIGGPGGGSYRSTCPDGWVVAGIQGGAGRVVDSISIVCKRLE